MKGWLLFRAIGFLIMLIAMNAFASMVELSAGERLALGMAFVGTGIWAVGAAKSLR